MTNEISFQIGIVERLSCYNETDNCMIGENNVARRNFQQTTKWKYSITLDGRVEAVGEKKFLRQIPPG